MRLPLPHLQCGVGTSGWHPAEKYSVLHITYVLRMDGLNGQSTHRRHWRCDHLLSSSTLASAVDMAHLRAIAEASSGDPEATWVSVSARTVKSQQTNADSQVLAIFGICERTPTGWIDQAGDI